MPTRPIKLALGFGDEGIARADEHVDRRDRISAERHCADRLDAAERIDLVGARKVHGGHDRWVRTRPSVIGRGGRAMRFTPATLAVTTLICAEATSGYLPPGT